MTDRLGRLLLVKLEAARLKGDLPVLGALHAWLDSWRGIGAVERGMRSRLRPPTHALRQPRLARNRLRDGDGAELWRAILFAYSWYHDALAETRRAQGDFDA
jgi:hypothetical protein